MRIPSSGPIVENQGHRQFHQNLAAPHTNRSLSRKDEDSIYDDHISDSSDDDLNTTPLTNRSVTGDEYEPVQSKFKHPFTHIYAHNKPPDQRFSTNAGFVSGSQKNNELKPRDDQIYDEGNAHVPDHDHRPISHPISTAAQEALPRRQGLISTFMRKRDGRARESREMHDAAPSQNAVLQHNTEEDVPSTHSSGWPLQNRKGGTNEPSLTSPIEEMGRGSAASGSIVKDDLTSDPRQQHELQGSSDPSHANISLSPEPKRKKFNSFRKMFKIND
jgi:hypothetical protein